MKIKCILLSLFLYLFVGSACAQLTIQVGDKKTEITSGSLTKMPQVKATIKDHDGKDLNYIGVSLFEVLVQSGVASGEKLRGKELSAYLIAEATDGYRVIFTMAELDPSLGNKSVVLAYRMNDAALPATQPPFRLVFVGDGKQARSIRMLKSIKYVKAE